MKYHLFISFFLAFGFICNAQDNSLPCDSTRAGKGVVIHFIKNKLKLVETKCDSLNHLVQIIHPSDSSKWVIIGIASSKTKEEKKKAQFRAELVKAELVQRGISPVRLLISTSYFKPPEPGRPKDWPFYPDNYDYEIGVYLRGEG